MSKIIIYILKIGGQTDPACKPYFNGEIFVGLYKVWGDRHDKSLKYTFFKQVCF